MPEFNISWESVPIDGGHLETTRLGQGEPVVIIQTALIADEFVSFGRQLAADFRVVLYHRRGYAGSSSATHPPSIDGDAQDCRALCHRLGIERVHIVGGSYSSAIALTLAVGHPQLVHSVSLIEAPPVITGSREEFLDACGAALAEYHALGASLALDRFLIRLIGPNWRTDIAEQLPDGEAAVERDSAAFFASDLPALMAWRFGILDAANITQPMCYAGGTESGAWFDEVRDQIVEWFPEGECVSVRGADHSLALTHPGEVATAIKSFLKRHPIPGEDSHISF